MYTMDVKQQYNSNNNESCAPLQRILSLHSDFLKSMGWSGGAMVLGRPTNLVDGRASAVGAGGGCLDIFSLDNFSSVFSLSLGDGLI